MPKENDATWFETWFDSPYYHTLYQHRNEAEAELFISRLLDFLSPNPGDNFLDLACGKGRHALQISERGFETLGVDLSANSITYASQFANDKLHFQVHDMREIIVGKQFNYIFNLFTSFGYFDDLNDNKKMLASIASMLKPKAKFVLDFFNAEKVVKQLIPLEHKRLSGIDFEIKKGIFDGKIIKSIDFEDQGQTYHFEEKVSCLSREQILAMMIEQGFNIEQEFGSYNLTSFDFAESDRLILVASLK